MKKQKIAFGVSGTGSTFEAIVKAIKKGSLDFDIAFVFADHQCPALVRANKLGVTSMVRSEDENIDDFHKRVVKGLIDQEVTLVALTGYLRFFPITADDPFLVLNSHPGAIPYFGGKGMYGIHVHEAVYQWLRDTDWAHPYTYSTVHVVTPEIDNGAILGISSLKVTDEMTPADIAKQLLPLEHANYIQVLGELSQGRQKECGYSTEYLELVD